MQARGCMPADTFVLIFKCVPARTFMRAPRLRFAAATLAASRTVQQENEVENLLIKNRKIC